MFANYQRKLGFFFFFSSKLMKASSRRLIGDPRPGILYSCGERGVWRNQLGSHLRPQAWNATTPFAPSRCTTTTTHAVSFMSGSRVRVESNRLPGAWFAKPAREQRENSG